MPGRSEKIKLEHIHGLLHVLTQKVDKVMATQAEHAAQLRSITARNDKARAEILAAIQVLKDALANAGGTTPEVDAAMAELEASVATDDDLNPDDEPAPI